MWSVRRVPHRLNSDERKLYDLAKQKMFLTIKGTAYRKERKGSPLANIFRQWCDAKAMPCILVEQGFGYDAQDAVLVDLATLRSEDLGGVAEACNRAAAAAGCAPVPNDTFKIPFTVIPAESVLAAPDMLDITGTLRGHRLEALQAAVALQGNRVRELKASGLANNDPAVQAEVHQLLGLKSRMERLSPSPSSKAVEAQESEQSVDPAVAFAEYPIWNIPAQLIMYKCDRSAAKQLAKALVDELSTYAAT
ncbi:hypothetical protein WJX72_007911 [[Myrmecia] bisecta]|uniref:WHEP-TRS domain-containing protein n=1 Tax=[Myrmecia] bisecta TaxID=41462 RepID=A0AAW1PJH1_9CHLO